MVWRGAAASAFSGARSAPGARPARTRRAWRSTRARRCASTCWAMRRCCVGGLPLEVGLGDAGGERGRGRLRVRARRGGAPQRGVERAAVAAPEVEVVREVERRVAAGAPRARDRRRVDAVLGVALARGLAVEREAGAGRGLGLAGRRVGLAHARLGDGHRGRILQREGDEAAQLRVAVVGQRGRAGAERGSRRRARRRRGRPRGPSPAWAPHPWTGSGAQAASTSGRSAAATAHAASMVSCGIVTC